MNINSLEMSGAVNGAMNSAPVVAVASAKTMGSPTPAQQTQTGGNGDVSPAKVKEMVTEMQSHLDSMNISLQYSLYGENSERISVKVVDKGTGAVIREIPSKEMQSLQTKMSELVGMIFNEKG